MSEQQPLLNKSSSTDSCKVDITNYDSIAYSALNNVEDVNVVNIEEIEDGCTPFQASFNTINLLGKYITEMKIIFYIIWNASSNIFWIQLNSSNVFFIIEKNKIK